MIARTRNLTRGIEIGRRDAWADIDEDGSSAGGKRRGGSSGQGNVSSKVSRPRRKQRGHRTASKESPFAASLPAWARGPRKRNVDAELGLLSAPARAVADDLADATEYRHRRQRKRRGVPAAELASSRRDVVRSLLDGTVPIASQHTDTRGRRVSRMDSEIQRASTEISAEMQKY